MGSNARARAAALAAEERRRRRRRRDVLAAAAAPAGPTLPVLVDLSSATAAAKFGSRETPTHTVYLKQNWGDEWTEWPYLFCSEAVWATSPSISTATLQWHYGAIAQERSAIFLEFFAAGLNRMLVRIDFQIDRITDEEDENYGQWNTRSWYGVVEIDEDRLGGALFTKDVDNSTPDETRYFVQISGAQSFVAYGLEFLLKRNYIGRSWWQAGVGDPPDDIERALTFNRDAKPNMHAEDTGDGLHYFAGDPDGAEHWSSLEIVRYLLAYQGPMNYSDGTVIPFELDEASAELTPSWDKPEAATHGRTTYDVLASLLSRQRLFGFYFTVEEAEEESDDKVKMHVFSYSPFAVPITLDGAASIPPNPNQIRLAFDEDPSALSTFKWSTLDKYDQVVMRGDRRRSVCNLSYADSSLEDGWSSAQETAYEAGASGEGDYPGAAEVKERRERNTEYRNRPELEDVFSRFQIPWDWALAAGDGLGGSTNPVFPQYVGDELSALSYAVYPPDMFVEATLPLKIGVDYSGDAIEDETFDESAATEDRRPWCAWPVPNTLPQRYRDAESNATLAAVEQIDSGQNSKWAAHLIVPRNGRSLRLKITGQPQHVIAHTSFVGQSEDESLGENTYQEAIFVVSLTDDRYCEARWPADSDLSEYRDYIRRLYIYAGRRYQLNYVVPQTVVGIDGSGELEVSNGGYVRDDRKLLEQAAKVAMLWYRDERRVLQLETGRLTSAVSRGYMVSRIGSTKTPGLGFDYEVNSPITEIRLTAELGDAETPPAPPAMRITTGAGELDPIRVLRQPFDLKADEGDGPGPPVTIEIGPNVSPGEMPRTHSPLPRTQ